MSTTTPSTGYHTVICLNCGRRNTASNVMCASCDERLASQEVEQANDPSYTRFQPLKRSFFVHDHLPLPKRKCIDCQSRVPHQANSRCPICGNAILPSEILGEIRQKAQALIKQIESLQEQSEEIKNKASGIDSEAKSLMRYKSAAGDASETQRLTARVLDQITTAKKALSEMRYSADDVIAHPLEAHGWEAAKPIIPLNLQFKNASDEVDKAQGLLKQAQQNAARERTIGRIKLIAIICAILVLAGLVAFFLIPRSEPPPPPVTPGSTNPIYYTQNGETDCDTIATHRVISVDSLKSINQNLVDIGCKDIPLGTKYVIPIPTATP